MLWRLCVWRQLSRNLICMDVSIVVPIYNVAPYLLRCLESVRRQDYNGEMECLLIDDCGQDNSMEIAESFVNSYVGPIAFRILHHNRNKGLSVARNTGTLAAKGEYVYYLDSDDEMTSDCISLMMDLTRKYDSVELVQGYIKCDFTDFYKLSAFDNIDYVDDNNWVRKNLYSTKNCHLAWNKLLRRSFLINNKLYFKEGIIHEDILWMFYVCKVLSKIAFLHKETYIHYQCENSIMDQVEKCNTQSCNCMGIILSDILKNISSPFASYQVYRYYNMWLRYKKDIPHSNRICILFLLASLKHGMILSSSFLFCTMFVPRQRGANFFQRRLVRINSRRGLASRRLL